MTNLSVTDGPFGIVLKNSNFASDGDVEIAMKDVDHAGNEGPLVLQKGAVMSFFSDGLRAAEIDVDGIDVRLDLQRRIEQRLRVIGAKLGDQRTIFVAGLK